MSTELISRTFTSVSLNGPIPAAISNAVVAIGNFDGVHRGHQAVLDVAKAEAEKLGVPAIVMTFEPHPRTLFNPKSPVFRLSAKDDKAALLAAYGMDGVVVCDFTAEFAATSAEVFVEQFLVRAIKARHVVIGFNFHFGQKRQGTPEFLQDSGQNHGFGVSIVEPRSDDLAKTQGLDQVISSSRIRRLLGGEKPEEAAQLLGYHWRVSGEVIMGKQLGRTLGFPTANMKLPDSCHLANGIYAVRLRLENGDLHDGVASYGRRPSVDSDGLEVLETFIFDFDQDIYGEEVSVSLFKHLRNEEKFDSLDDLVIQMKRDETQARDYLKSVAPVSPLDRRINFTGNTKSSK